MFRTNYPGVPIEDFHDVMQILERSQVISLEGSSGFYHLNRPYLDERATVKITRRQIRRIIQEANRRSERKEEEVVKIMERVFDDFQKKYPQFGRVARRPQKGRPSFANIKADFYLKIPGEKRNLTFDIQVYSQASGPMLKQAYGNTVDVVLDFDYAPHNLFDSYVFEIDDVLGSRGQLVLGKMGQYAESILKAYGPVPLSEAKEDITDDQMEEIVRDTYARLRDHWKLLAKKYKAVKEIVSYSAVQKQGNQIYIEFHDGGSTSHGVVSAEILPVMTNAQKTVEVKVNWYYDMPGGPVKNQQGQIISQESGGEYLELDDWADDPKYMAEDYVNHVIEYIDRILDATGEGAGQG